MTPLKVDSQVPSTVEKVLQLLIFISATVTSIYVFVSIIANFLSFKIWGISFVNVDLESVFEERELASAKFTQFFYQIGAFLAPALFFVLITRQNVVAYFKLNKSLNSKTVLSILLLLLLAVLSTSYLMGVLDWVNWPKQVLDSEALSGSLMQQLLNTKTISGWLVNLAMFVIVPAFVEEIYFRGVLQRQLQGLAGNAHIAIFISSFVFAAVHGQLTGILAFWLMGLVLGYIYYITGNLWYSIIFHFLNNGFSLLLDGLYRNGSLSFNPNTFAVPAILGIICLVLIAIVLYTLHKNHVLVHVSNTTEIAWVKVYESNDAINAQLICDRLEAEGYSPTLINKKDSNYGFGLAEIHVPYHQLESALAFIKTLNL